MPERRTNRRKPKWMPKTKTFLLNVLVLIGTLGTYFLSAPEFKDVIKDHALWILGVTSAANIFVRQLTDQPAAWTRPPADDSTPVGDD